MRISDWSSDVCSSDLLFSIAGGSFAGAIGFATLVVLLALVVPLSQADRRTVDASAIPPSIHTIEDDRSEEHTSELQSLMRISYAVFCLTKTKTYKYILTHVHTCTT